LEQQPCSDQSNVFKKMSIKVNSSGIAAFLAISGIVMFSAKAIMVKLSYRFDADVLTVLLLRMVFALPFYLVIAYRSLKNQEGYRLTKRDFISLLALGFIGYYAASYFDFLGLKYISASLERLILFVYPTLVILITWIALQKRPTRIQVFAIILTYGGILLAFADDLEMSGNGMWKGVILIFLSAFTYAIYLVGSGRMIPKIGPVRFTSYAMIMSHVLVIIHYSINEYDGSTASALANLCTWIFYGYFFHSSALVFDIRSYQENWDHRILPFMAVWGPISTIILAVIFLGERLDYYQIAGTDSRDFWCKYHQFEKISEIVLY
jgi:drug/metabolite transporter (DMT)-like permease